MIFIVAPFFISFLTGYFFILYLFKDRRPPELFLHLFLAAGLGMGISGVISFCSLLTFNYIHPLFVQTIHILFLLSLIVACARLIPKRRFLVFPSAFFWKVLSFAFLGLVSLPLWDQSLFYAFGGWDAWSTWNLKAKFLFLGKTQWSNMLDPSLWRSSPHYPLLLPLINVWGWCWTKTPASHIPIITAFSVTFLTASLLWAGIRYITNKSWGLLPAVFLLSSPFLNKLSLSQYADGLLGYYLLATFVCLVSAKTQSCQFFSFLAGVFCGLLSFTKPEGTVLAGLIIFFSIPYLLWTTKNNNTRPLLLTFLVATGISLLPTVIFKLIYSPGNQTFINGLTSIEHPSQLMRLKIILGFYLVEMFGPLWNIGLLLNPHSTMSPLELKWTSVWVVIIFMMLLSFKHLFKKDFLIIPSVLLAYMIILTLYYFINTYFPIEWWLQVTLHRLLAAILPSVLFWVFCLSEESSPKPNNNDLPKSPPVSTSETTQTRLSTDG